MHLHINMDHAIPVLVTSVALTMPINFIADLATRVVSTALTAIVVSLVTIALQRVTRRWSLPPEAPKGEPQPARPKNVLDGASPIDQEPGKGPKEPH